MDFVPAVMLVKKFVVRYTAVIPFDVLTTIASYLIVLFVRQHFSGSLFHLITLLLFTRKTTQGKRERRSNGAFPSPLRFSPLWLPLS